MTDHTISKTTGRLDWWRIGLWTAQILLAVVYLAAGSAKLSQPIDALVAMGMTFVLSFPEIVVRLIGLAEVLGALGLILPTVTRILPLLTPLAAVGLTVLQIGAIFTHVSIGEVSSLPFNVVLLALSGFIAWGRWFKRPLAAGR